MVKRSAQIGACLALVSLASCSRVTVAWRIRFENRADAMATRVVEARVHRGTCDGEVVWQGRVNQGEALSGMGIPQLDDGLYAFEAVARDASCRTLASECMLAASPFGGPVTLVLPSRPMPASCDAALCTDGTCVEGDTGPRDAGLDAPIDASTPPADTGFDATPDAPLDSGPPDAPIDVGPPDAFTPPDAFITPPSAPVVVAPWSGVTTGAPVSDATLIDSPLRPQIIWEPVSGAGSYVIEFTRCDLADWRGCRMLPPTHVEPVAGGLDRARPSIDLPVALTAPVGARYVFRVGACATADQRGCAYAAYRYIDVGRAWRDLDGDGAADLVGISFGSGMYSLQQVNVSTGTLRPHPPTPSVMNSLVAIGDYDGDGVGEMIARTASAPGGSYFYVDDFAIGMSVEELTASARLGQRIVPAGDLDADGFADFVVTAPGLRLVRVQLGGSVFNAAARVDLPLPSTGTDFGFELCGAGDVNQDGRADLAVAFLLDPTTAEIRYYTVRPDRLVDTIARTPALRVTTGLSGPVIDGLPIMQLMCGADVDGNGRPETIVGRFRLSELLIRDDTSLAITDSGSLGAKIAWGDLDGDGIARIFASRPGVPRAPANGTALLRVAPDRTSTLSTWNTSVELVQANGDFDGDGRDDVLFWNMPNMHVVMSRAMLDVAPPSGTTWRSVGN